MKIKINCKEENYQRFLLDLKNGNIEVSETNADLVVVENDMEVNTLLGKNGNEYFVIKSQEILYIEGSNNDVICVSSNQNSYFLKEKLYELEFKLFNKGFIRVSKSHIVNKEFIESIKPSINMKFIIKMKDNIRIDVTRSYYYKFKDYFNF